MTTLDRAAEAMLQMQDGNRSIAAAIGRAFNAFLASRGPTTLGSPSFVQQEPDLAKETHLPGTYGTR